MPRKNKKSPPPTRALAKRRPSRKASQDEIADRRRDVVRLRMQGLGYRAIGQKLGIGHMTVKRDIEAVREQNAGRISQFERDHLLAETVSVYEHIEEEAWKQYHSPITGAAQKARFLDVVRGARGDQVKLLTELGFLKRAPIEHEHKVRADVISHWTPDAQDVVALALVRGMTTPAAEPTREIIEVTQPPALTSGDNGVSHPDPKSEDDEEAAA